MKAFMTVNSTFLAQLVQQGTEGVPEVIYTQLAISTHYKVQDQAVSLEESEFKSGDTKNNR